LTILTIISYILWGLIIGLVVGMTAIGTGLLGSPGLILLFGVSPVTAVGTMGLAGVVMMTTGVMTHFKHRNVHLKTALLFALTSIPASWLTATRADQLNELFPLKNIISIILILSVILLGIRFYVLKPNLDEDWTFKTKHYFIIPLIGLILGSVIGATSISGSIVLISFILLLKLPNKLAVGTTSAVSAVTLALASVAHISENHIDWIIFLCLFPGVMTGAWLGAKLAHRIHGKLLRNIIMGILVVAGIAVVLKG